MKRARNGLEIGRGHEDKRFERGESDQIIGLKHRSFMKKLLIGLIAITSLSAFAQESINFKGIENKKNGNTIAVTCGQNGLQPDRCQFVEISAQESTAPATLSKGKNFSHDEIISIVDKVIKDKLTHRRFDSYLVTSEVFHEISTDNPDCDSAAVTGLACGIRWVMIAPTFGLASFVLESSYEGGRAVVAAIINHKRVEDLSLKVVRVPNRRYGEVKSAIDAL